MSIARWTIAAAACSALLLAGCGGAETRADAAPASAASTAASTAEALPEKAVCPVMKHEFKPTSETVTAEYKGKTYYFCCPGCDEKFAADPEKYVSE